MRIEQFFVEGLGHQSHIVADDASGVAAVIDPRRDVEVYLAAAGQANLRITHVLETHLHNDYVTGARELAARTGATIVSSAAAQLAYDYLPVHDGATVMLGTVRFSVLATPGHTPEHVSYLLHEPGTGAPFALFSGGSMLVNGVGRTDLLGEAQTPALTRQQYTSLCRLLASLPDAVLVYPTHGAGSFCGASAVSPQRHTTIGAERLVNPAAGAADEAAFVRHQLAGYGEYPAYYAFMREINQRGPRVLGGVPESVPLHPVDVQARQAAGAAVVDGRQRGAFASAHIPGALNIELDGDFGTYAGWVLPFNAPLVLVLEDAPGRREALAQLFRIGYERVEGHLEGGIAAWTRAGLPVARLTQISVRELFALWKQPDAPMVVDVRRADEWREGHIPGALHLHIGELPQRLAAVPSGGTAALICASGYRAQIAASLLAAQGRTVLAVDGGVPAWQRAGLPIAVDDPPAAAPAPDEHGHL